MSAPMTLERLAEIRADLDAVPAPPWRWIGVRGSGGPQLVTDHSGRQYLLRAKKPADAAGDEVLDFVTDAPVYGDLEFRDQRPGETYSTMRAGDQLAIGRADYDSDAIVGVDNPVARWVERSASHAAALLAEVERLAAELAKYVGQELTLAEEALYAHEQQVRARIAQDVNRAERPVFPATETPENVVAVTRAIDTRLIELGPAAPYWVPEAGEPR